MRINLKWHQSNDPDEEHLLAGDTQDEQPLYAHVEKVGHEWKGVVQSLDIVEATFGTRAEAKKWCDDYWKAEEVIDRLDGA